jgi:hypothetical protein
MQELSYTLCVQESFNEVDFTVQCFNGIMAIKHGVLLFWILFRFSLLDGFYLKTHIANTKKLPFSFYSIEMAKAQKWIASHRLQSSEQIGTIN